MVISGASKDTKQNTSFKGETKWEPLKNTIDPNQLDEAFSQIGDMFGKENNLMNTIFSMSKELMTNSNVDLNKLQTGDPNEFKNLMLSVSNIMENKQAKGEINAEKINKDAMDLMSKMMSGKNDLLNKQKVKPMKRKKKNK